MNKTVFRTYDIRGIVGTQLYIEQVGSCIKSLVYLIKKKIGHLQAISVAMDGRVHSNAIKDEVVAALCQAGIDVYYLGLAPTPVHDYAHHVLPVQASLMITASHNPKEYNGIKIIVAGEPFFGADLQTLYDLYANQVHTRVTKRGIVRNFDITNVYLLFITTRFNHLHSLALPLIFDCSNGATCAIVTELIAKLEWQNARVINGNIDGTFPAHDPDPTKLKNMQQLIEDCRSKQSAGIAFDADGDRMSAITEDGRLLVGDDLGGIFCADMSIRHKKFTAVMDIKCSFSITKWLEAKGITVEQTPCGHAFVVEGMNRTGAFFGGELSCHYCFADDHFGSDDGIYAALRLVEIMHFRQATLTALANELPERYLSPEMRIICPEELKETIVHAIIEQISADNTWQLNLIDGLCALRDGSAVTLRKSNTESMLSVRFEAQTPEQLKAIAQLFYHLLLQWLAPESLAPHFSAYL